MKRKTPQEKKSESYAKDRRNTYGENSKASRKSIPRHKQRSHQLDRRIASEGLRVDGGEVDLERADAAETRRLLAAKYAFKKQPDQPLGEVLKRRGKR